MRSAFVLRNQAAMGQGQRVPAGASYVPAPNPYVKSPGAIGAADRTRMLNSLSLDDMDAYSLLDGPGRSAYEDAWLARNPAGSSTATEWHFAENTLGLANGTIAAAIASNDRAQSEALAARTQQALANLQIQRDAATLPLDRMRIQLQIDTMQSAHDALIAQTNAGVVNTQTIVIGVVASVLILGGAYVIASQARKNPVVSRSGARVFIPMQLLPEKEQRRERRNPSEGETVYQINTNDHDSFGEYTNRQDTIAHMEGMEKSSRFKGRGLHVLKIHKSNGRLHWEIVAGHGKGEKGVA